MKPFISFFLILYSILMMFSDSSYCDTQKNIIYVIPIKDMIERALIHVIERGITEAERAGANTIIFDMDTPGGRLDATEEIINLITSSKAKTYTFVNTKAISAGAIIAMSTDHIYMTPGGRIGDAMPIMMSPLPFGSPKEMPKGLKEKAVSPTVALIRSVAQRKGYDPNLAESMVRPEFEYKIGDKIICPKGQLLTLTSKDAEQLVGQDNHHLISSGTVKNIDDLLKEIGKKDSHIVIISSTVAEKIARIIEGFPMSGILLALGLLALYIEFKTPGLGIPGITGVIILGIWFWGHHIAGLAGSAELIVFMLGILLLFLEIFIIPGFGITGVSGFILIVISLMMAMVEHYPFSSPWHPYVPRMEISILNLALSLLIAFISAISLSKFLPKTRIFNKLVLDFSESSTNGFQASGKTNELIGITGVTVTPLRPAGIGLFDNKRINIIARGEFIQKNKPIIIAEAHGNRIVVDVINT